MVKRCVFARWLLACTRYGAARDVISRQSSGDDDGAEPVSGSLPQLLKELKGYPFLAAAATILS